MSVYVAPDRSVSLALGGLLALALAYAACAPVQRGPFVAQPPVRCAADPDCKPGTHCGFPAVDTHAVCLDGQGDADPEIEIR